MRSGILNRAFPFVLLVMALVARTAAPATAAPAEPALYRLPHATHARSLAVAADGTVWFVPSRGSEWEGESESIIGSIASDGTLTEHEVVGFVSVHQLALGPNGDIWVAGRVADGGTRSVAVGRLSPLGAFEQRYAAGPGDGSSVENPRLTVTDEAVWFVNRTEGREAIDRLSIADGAVSRFEAQPGCSPTALAAGSGGVLWFAEACRRRKPDGESVKRRGVIGRISPGGSVFRRRLTAIGRPISIAPGKHGTVWFGLTNVGFSADLVGRLTRRGDLAEYRVGYAYPNSIAVGPEGNLWFRSGYGRRRSHLISIDTAGNFTKPICAEPSCELEPEDLTSAPDGSLWYGLASPNLNTGGGGSGIYIDMEIANEAGLVAHLIP